jgi:phytoene dehydrogenase-like protein
VHPLAIASGFFRRFELRKRVEFAVPDASYGHPLDGGRAAIAWRDLDRTAEELGRDGAAWRRLLKPLVDRAGEVAQFTLSPLLQVPRHPLAALWFGLRSLEQGTIDWNTRFAEEAAPALLTGVFAHAVQPMPSISSAGAGLSLATAAHRGGWPIPIGGSQSIVNAMAADLAAHGGEIVTGVEVTDLAELPSAKALLFDTSAAALERIAGDRLPARYRRALRRFPYGNGVAKVDYALDGPVPWANQQLAETPTLHVGGTRAELATAEADVAAGRHPRNPYVLVAQPSRWDASRAPEGKHVLWAYTHVPRGSTVDRAEAVTAQIERFAPGFRDRILAVSSRTAAEVAAYNPNYPGGDIGSGDVGFGQLLARPVLAADPWRTPGDGVYLCSSSAAPGPGVHGLAGYYAARSALRHDFGVTDPVHLGMEN